MTQNKRLVIAVDCDDVVVESVPAILAWYNRQYGTNVQPADFYGRDLSPWGVAEDDVAIKRVNLYLQTDEYQNLPPLQEAVRVLQRLSQAHELHLVTGRADFLQAATQAWLITHLPDVFTSLEFTNYIVPKEHAHRTRTKAEVCKQLKADLLIDDHLHHAKQVAASGVPVLLFGDYDWNQSDTELPTGIVRAANWREVEECINGRI